MLTMTDIIAVIIALIVGNAVLVIAVLRVRTLEREVLRLRRILRKG